MSHIEIFGHRAWAQEFLAMKEAASPSRFFNRLAAFFSFGDRMACFFTSLLDRCDLDMMSTPNRVKGDAHGAMGGELKVNCPGAPVCPGLLSDATHVKYGREMAEKIGIFRMCNKLDFSTICSAIVGRGVNRSNLNPQAGRKEGGNCAKLVVVKRYQKH